MIEVQSLTKNYGDYKAVDNISFRVERGEILGFLGQNGAGKTTTMKILTGFMPATSGKAILAGFNVFDQPFEVKKRIGYLPETPPLYSELLVTEYLDFVADLRGVPKSEKRKKIDAAIAKLNLGEVRRRLIGNLSKGFRQRVGIAQAILHDPEILIMDEPTIGLDPKQVHEVRELIRSMKGRMTLIYSTHILSEVAATCDRIIVIDRGKLVAQESVASSLDMETTEIIVEKMEQSVVGMLEKIPGVHSVKATTNGVNRIVVKSDPNSKIMSELSSVVVGKQLGLVRLAPVKLDLEEYYLGLIGAKTDRRTA